MNISVAFILALTIVGTHQSLNDAGLKLRNVLAAFRTECLNEYKADPDLIEKLITDGVFPDDNDLKCYIRCITFKSKFLLSDSKVNVEFIKTSLSDSIADSIVKNCANVKKVGGECDEAYGYLQCVYNTIHNQLKD
ncbi:hypothetical protein FQA39_LY05862 [Lamprigera yunnana]|nr:hypothetical protein FQA39_LY05861 [Lamprigera yunnana]KAF5278373.1 hypothetical protein FQA39_LY05862 [Lamprigera yunnana]